MDGAPKGSFHVVSKSGGMGKEREAKARPDEVVKEQRKRSREQSKAARDDAMATGRGRGKGRGSGSSSGFVPFFSDNRERQTILLWYPQDCFAADLFYAVISGQRWPSRQCQQCWRQRLFRFRENIFQLSRLTSLSWKWRTTLPLGFYLFIFEVVVLVSLVSST
jgi:hypothetical protein